MENRNGFNSATVKERKRKMIFLKEKPKVKRVRAAVLDFDGTLSTLRCGWETVMGPMMVEFISGGNADAETLDKIKKEVEKYIDESTGIQTIAQMKWLRDTVNSYGLNKNAPNDIWEYKAEYNRRLMENVMQRRKDVESGKTPREKYLIGGAEDFLKILKAHGVDIYAASGTDTVDVRAEAKILGLDGYFKSIEGAEPHSENCSKEAVIASLLERNKGESGMLVCGDGKVEIKLGAEAGALALGIASNEETGQGINEAKLERLKAAGAHSVIGDFLDIKEIEEWIFN